jgi:hypothetical protein
VNYRSWVPHYQFTIPMAGDAEAESPSPHVRAGTPQRDGNPIVGRGSPGHSKIPKIQTAFFPINFSSLPSHNSTQTPFSSPTNLSGNLTATTGLRRSHCYAFDGDTRLQVSPSPQQPIYPAALFVPFRPSVNSDAVLIAPACPLQELPMRGQLVVR